MKKIAKASIALAAVGGTFLMAAPMAFAGTDPSVAQISAGASGQWQNGSGASDTVMDQNSNVSVGQLQAKNYYNSQSSKGGYTSTTTYSDDGVTPSSQTSAGSDGGSSWMSAHNYSDQGATVSQSQTQVIGSDSMAGGKQGQVSGAISGAVDEDWNVTGGLAVSGQKQNGRDANDSTLSQTSTTQAGETQASQLTSDSKNLASWSASTQYLDGVPNSQTSLYDNGSSTYTQATNLNNPTAGLTQDQNQVIGGQGGWQGQAGGAVAGQVTSEFWQSLY